MTDVSFGRDVKNWSLYENIFVRDKSFGNFIGWTYWCKFTNTNWYMIEWWSELSEYRHQIAQLVELEGARVWIPVLSIIISTIPTFTTFFTYINKQTSLVTGIWWKKTLRWRFSRPGLILRQSSFLPFYYIWIPIGLMGWYCEMMVNKGCESSWTTRHIKSFRERNVTI